MIRLLLDPTADGGGSSFVAVSATPPPAAKPEGATSHNPPAPAHDTLSLPKAEVEALFAAKRSFEELTRSMEAKVREAADGRLAEAAKDKADAVQKLRQEADAEKSTLAGSWLAAEKSRVIASSLAGIALVETPEAAEQLQLLLETSVDAVMENGKPVVRDRRTGQPAEATLKAMLASPAFAHFLKAKTQGGAPAPSAAAPANPAAPAPGSVEAVAAAWKAQQGQYGSFGLGPASR